jgi:CheY-specific phosphatase CheX
MTQNEDHMAEATIGDLANLATANAADSRQRCGGISDTCKF